MRLHPLVALALVCAPAVAGAEPVRGSAPKQVEAQRGKPGKLSTQVSTQLQLFIEQKDAPTASKTAMRLEGAPRLSDKQKD